MNDILNAENLGKALGLPYDSDGYDEKSLLALHAELQLAKELVWQRLMQRSFERMDKEDQIRKEAREQAGSQDD